MKKIKSKNPPLVKIILIVVIIFLLTIIIISGQRIFEIQSEYKKADEVQKSLQQYDPVFTMNTINVENQSENLSIIQLNEAYPDIVGWLSINNTNINYPFVQGVDNEQYLRTTLDGDYVVSGTVFLDYRVSNEFSDLNSILYGHLMNNGTMFSDIEKFSEKSYFDSHLTGNIFLMNETLDLEVVSYMVVDSLDPIIYNPVVSISEFLPYIEDHSVYFRDLNFEESDRFITLSTCTNDSKDLRSILVLKIVD